MLRKLSGAEYGMAEAGQRMPMQFSTTARIRGDFSLAELRTALAKVRRRHPLLGVRIIQDADGQPWFTQEGVPDFPLRVVENAREDEWVPVLAEELLQPFAWETGPLVRFVWLRGQDWSDLIVLSHHAISDGLAGAYLMRDLLHHLGNPNAPVEPLPLLPPTHELVPPEVDAALSKMSIPDLLALSSFSSAQDRKPGRVGKYATHLAFALFKSPVGPLIGRLRRAVARKPRHPSIIASPSGVPRLCLSAWSLDHAQTAALIARAKQEGTTVHAALGAAFLLTFAQVIGAGQWRRTIQSPVNLRKRLSPPVGEDFGVFMTLVKTTVDCSPGRDFWDVARDIKEGFNRQTTPERLFAMYGLMKALSGLNESLLETMISEEAFSSLEYELSLSNIGQLDIPTKYGPLQLESLYGPTFSAIGDRIVGVNTTGGRMFFTFIAQETIMDAATGGRVRELAMRRLGEAVGW